MIKYIPWSTLATIFFCKKANDTTVRKLALSVERAPYQSEMNPKNEGATLCPTYRRPRHV